MRGKRDGWTLWRRLRAAEGVEDLDKSLTSVRDEQHK